MAEANEVEVTTENEVVETEQQAEPVDCKLHFFILTPWWC